eukprot:SAG31_NODE_2393_length_5793_cov_18.326484_2_plen_212_part_00
MWRSTRLVERESSSRHVLNVVLLATLSCLVPAGSESGSDLSVPPGGARAGAGIARARPPHGSSAAVKAVVWGSASMAPPTTATDFLRALGTNSVPHGSRFLDLKHGSFFDHLVGTYEVLERWGAATSVCLAGMYHSVYGTEGFQGFTLPISERSAVADVIGGRAEFAAFINCAMDRDSLDSLALAHIRDEKRCEQRLVSAMRGAPIASLTT